AVRHVMNLTDVDDKTIAGAMREGKGLGDYTAGYIQAFREDLAVLGCLAPTEQPRATEEIPAMLDLIAALVGDGKAYEREGSVYYRVAAFPAYGRLSKKKLDWNIAGASTRVDLDEYDREQISDFVLWKKSKEGEPSWDSPWGPGRPGWHIECSAMSMKYLGETFDLHAGGEDLIFPHHENEIAQSEAATGKTFVRFWLHCKFLLVNGEKMSKSKGNFYTLRDLLAKGCDPAAIRFSLVGTHYRSPLNFTLDGLKEAAESVRKMDDSYYQCLSRLAFGMFGDGSGAEGFLEVPYRDMMRHLGDDLNVAAALSELLAGLTQINTLLPKMNEGELKSALDFFAQMDRLLGFGLCDPEGIPEEVRRLVSRRALVRQRIKEQNDKSLWKESDELRDQIHGLGWLVKDGKPGECSTVKRKRRTWDNP
ncbi:MAG: cysteine--tRNA ligase, partial [Candidatus Omnitrophota bacterium]